jgi:peroxiredoxin
MDCNGDGWIDQGSNSEEWATAENDSPIFHVNGRYLSTVSLDLKGRTFVVREHPAEDYLRIPLRVGYVVPDFAFTDLDGKAHKFSEFRGKYMLMDFWGTWCPACRKELPDLEKAFRQFRARNFAILGIGDDKDLQKARKVLGEAGVTYPQSSGETGYDLVHKRFGVTAFPSKALVNPEGKIIALDDSQGSFRAGNITATLDKLLPPAK